MISGILNNPETKEDYYGLVYSAITFIAEQMSAVEEGLIQDAEMLLTMIQLIIDNREAEEKYFSLYAIALQYLFVHILKNIEISIY